MNQPPNGQGNAGEAQPPEHEQQPGFPQQGYPQQPNYPQQAPQHGYPQQQQYPQQHQGGGQQNYGGRHDQGAPGYLPPGSPGLEPEGPKKTAMYAAVVVALFILLGGGAIAYVVTRAPSGVTEAVGGSTTVAPNSVLGTGGSVVTQVPNTSKPATTVKRATIRSTKPATATTTAVAPTTAAGATSQPVATTVANVCGAGVGSAATGIGTGDPFLIAKVEDPGGERRIDLILDAGDTVQVDVFMLDFDPVAEVVDANGSVVAFNDDGPFGLDSQVTFTVATGGFHSVYVYSANANGCGLFEIEAIVVGTGGGSTAPLSPPDNYSFVVSLTAALTPIDIELLAGDRLAIYVIDAGMGTDPVISLTSPTGAPAGTDDDGASGIEGPLDSLLEVTVAESGTYRGFIESTNGVAGDASVIVFIN